MNELTGRTRHRAGGLRGRKLVLQVEEWFSFSDQWGYKYRYRNWRDARVEDLELLPELSKEQD